MIVCSLRKLHKHAPLHRTSPRIDASPPPPDPSLPRLSPAPLRRRGGIMAAMRAFWNSPVGPKTTHFWGPVANWGFVVAGLVDTQKPPEMISGNMTGVMCVYSGLFMRFAWMVQPRNYLLLGVHVSNEAVQLYQFQRWYRWYSAQTKTDPEK